MNEIWVPIPDYEAHYEASSLGRIKSLPRKVRSKENSFRISSGRILKPTKSNTGYLKVDLCKDGIRKSHHVHSLVAQAFLNHQPGGREMMVDHVDNNKTNNRIDNIRVVTARVNSSKDRVKRHGSLTGAHLIPHSGRWRARIRINGKSKSLGCFSTELEAHKAYKNEL